MNKKKSGAVAHIDPEYRNKSTYIKQNKNDLYDDIMDKYIPLVKENIMKRNQDK